MLYVYRPSEAHPAVGCAQHEDDLIRSAGGVERLPLAVLAQLADAVRFHGGARGSVRLRHCFKESTNKDIIINIYGTESRVVNMQQIANNKLILLNELRINE